MHFLTLFLTTSAALAAATSTTTFDTTNLSARDLNDAYELLSRFDHETKTLKPRDEMKGGGGGRGGGKGGKGGKGKGGKGGAPMTECEQCQACIAPCNDMIGMWAASGCSIGCATSKACRHSHC